ncbi:hypothetical protein B7494_g2161 [Chlorociboria aeruginascens]|nr:hypothetical protein B7494_g2161 [Chlorociboria aeruginascens]
MLRDDEAFPIMMQTPAGDAEEAQDIHQRVYENDDLNDVFGSEPASPTDFDTLHDFDDVHADLRDGDHGGRARNTEVSDVPRLKEKHETEGYRDGVTKGKAESVQAGFDEGYGLGAVLGLKVGKIIGLLEGILSALAVAAKSGDAAAPNWVGERERVEVLFIAAKKELSTENVFGRQWWGEDGIWKFEIPGEKEEGKEVVFEDVAKAHPVVERWEGIVAEEVTKWGLDMVPIENEDLGKETEGTREVVALKENIAAGARKELNW